MKPSRRVDDHAVSLFSVGLGHRVERHGRGVGALWAPHYPSTHPVTPGLQLLSSCSPEGVGGPQHNRVPIGHQDPGEFAGGRGLAGPVHPDHHNHRGPLALTGSDQRPVRCGSHQRQQLLVQRDLPVDLPLNPQSGAQPIHQV